MPIVIPPGFAQVSQPIFDNAALDTNFITYGIDLDVTLEDAGVVVDALMAVFVEQWGSQLDNAMTIQPTRMQIGNDGPPLVAVASTPSVACTRAVTKGPPSNAVILTKRTAFGGRAFRGRIYMPAMLSQTDTDEAGRVIPARLTAIQGVANAWRNRLAAGTGALVPAGPQPMVLLHGPPITGGPTPAPSVVTSLQAQTIIGTQTRRLPQI